MREEYKAAEQNFADLIATDLLDEQISERPQTAWVFERGLKNAFAAIGDGTGNLFGTTSTCESAHLFLQRVLYRINRLKLFWFDQLKNYDNERSVYLHEIQARVERAWQRWELNLLDVAALAREDVAEALSRRAARDVISPPSTSGL